jgi:hypothetical protein
MFFDGSFNIFKTHIYSSSFAHPNEIIYSFLNHLSLFVVNLAKLYKNATLTYATNLANIDFESKLIH